MSDIHVLEPLQMTPSGPVVSEHGGDPVEVFLKQGSLDGACGLYSIFMLLLICGVVTRAELEASSNDRRSRAGRLLQAIRDQFSALVKEGAQLETLRDLLARSFSSRVEWECVSWEGLKARDFVSVHVSNDHPVVLQLQGPNLSHFVLVIGTEKRHFESAEDPIVTSFLLLDPAGDLPAAAPWNATADVEGDKGVYHFSRGATDTAVQFAGALAAWPVTR